MEMVCVSSTNHYFEQNLISQVHHIWLKPKRKSTQLCPLNPYNKKEKKKA